MKLAERAYLGCDLTPCANCICLNVSSWFGKVRVARARRGDVTMHTDTRTRCGGVYGNCKNGCEVLAELGLEAKPRPPSFPSTRTAHYARASLGVGVSTCVGVEASGC